MKKISVGIVMDAMKSQWFLAQPTDPDWSGDQWVFSRRPKNGDCFYDAIQIDDKISKRPVGIEQPKIMLIGILHEIGYDYDYISNVVYVGPTKFEALKNTERYVRTYNAIQLRASVLLLKAGDISRVEDKAYRRWLMIHARVITKITNSDNTLNIEKLW